MKEPQKISLVEILTKSPSFCKIVNKVDQLAKLNRIVQQKLDPELRPYCRVANIRDGILVLSTATPALGHLLRFSKLELLSALRSDPEWCHLKAIKTQVSPEEALYTQIPALVFPGPILSKTSADLVKTTALVLDGVAPALSQALLKLSRRKICGNRDL